MSDRQTVALTELITSAGIGYEGDDITASVDKDIDEVLTTAVTIAIPCPRSMSEYHSELPKFGAEHGGDINSVVVDVSCSTDLTAIAVIMSEHQSKPVNEVGVDGGGEKGAAVVDSNIPIICAAQLQYEELANSTIGGEDGGNDDTPLITTIHTMDSQSKELANVHVVGSCSDDLLSGSDHGNKEECTESLVITNKEAQGKCTTNYFSE
jgi:hypothetical protein